MSVSQNGFLNQQLLTAREIGQMIPSRISGKTVSPATIRRWQTVGLRGIHLGYVIAGGLRCSTKDHLEEFFEQLTQQDLSHRFCMHQKQSTTNVASSVSQSKRFLQCDAEAKKLGL